jgi:hypothetical protein
MKTCDTLPELTEALQAAGYVRGTPSTCTAENDAEVWAEAICGACGRQGLELHPWVRSGSYRAVAACPGCGAAEEI